MKKHVLFALTLFFAVGMMAEAIPEGYYDGINGKKDAELKTTLSELVRGGIRYDYGVTTYHTSSKPGEWEKGDLKAYGTWQALPETDMHPDGIVWDMYSNCVRYYPNKRGDSGCSLNIEHCLPKSWWGGVDNEAYKDLFNLNPSDQQANTNKSNFPPGHVKKGDKFNNGSFLMDKANTSEYGYICWEPAEEYRGDFARTYFYMATAYEYLEWTAYKDYISNDSYLMFSDKIIEVLLDWHRADPVSDKERCRADRISSIQGNRNPYIDYPELIEYIWGEKKGNAVDLASLTCAFEPDVCPDPVIPAPDPQKYDTIINLPAIPKKAVSSYTSGTIQGSESEKNQSNGNCSLTMGASSTDGYIQFTGLNLEEDAIAAFRASPYNTATSMQLDVYADETIVQTIQVTVEQSTRHEVRYRVPIPKGTQSLKIISVGGSTTKRACMQEFYLLIPRGESEGVCNTPASEVTACKQIRDGKVVILRNSSIYSTLGQKIR